MTLDPEATFGPDVDYEPRHEDAMLDVLHDLDLPGDVDFIGVGHRILTALGKKGLLR